MDFKEALIEKIKTMFPDSIQEINDFRNDLTITIDEQKKIEICSFLKEDPELNFRMCEDVTAIDWAKRTNRFTLVYHIYSLSNKFRLRIKANLQSSETDSITSVYPSANWYERETFDMYGIIFRNHPDLRRMYMPEEFEYFPLRKEFPLMGIPGSLPLPKK